MLWRVEERRNKLRSSLVVYFCASKISKNNDFLPYSSKQAVKAYEGKRMDILYALDAFFMLPSENYKKM